MDYKRNYYKLINSRKLLNRKKGKGVYYEKHHIIPKSLGGNNDEDNLILLTPKEHFIAHLLLTKMYEGKEKAKMYFAFWRLCSSGRNIFGARQYSHAKHLFSKAMSAISLGKEGYWKNRKHSEETKKRMSESHTGISKSEEHCKNISEGRKGIEFSEEHKKNIGLSKIGNTYSVGLVRSEETKQKIKEKRALQIITDETKNKISKAHKGKIVSEETKIKISEKRKKMFAEGYIHPKTGTIHSDETKRKMSEARKKYYSEKKNIETTNNI
jgi:hypothetical protein